MKPLADRLLLKPGMAAAVIGAPDDVATDLDATRGLKVPGKGKVALDWLLVFVRDRATVRRIAGTVVRAIKPDAILWFAYPKLTGAIRTDINREQAGSRSACSASTRSPRSRSTTPGRRCASARSGRSAVGSPRFAQRTQ